MGDEFIRTRRKQNAASVRQIQIKILIIWLWRAYREDEEADDEEGLCAFTPRYVSAPHRDANALAEQHETHRAHRHCASDNQRVEVV